MGTMAGTGAGLLMAKAIVQARLSGTAANIRLRHEVMKAAQGLVAPHRLNATEIAARVTDRRLPEGDNFYRPNP